MTPQGAPLRAAALLLGLWLAGRGAWLWHEAGTAVAPQQGPSNREVAAIASLTHMQPAMAMRLSSASRPLAEPHRPKLILASLAVAPSSPAADDAAPAPPPLSLPAAALHRSRLSGSAWLLLRGKGVTSLAASGQLGGSQAGMRLDWRIAGTASLQARLSTGLDRPHGAEAAIGLGWQPVRGLELAVERRTGLDAAGRDAFATHVAGGLWHPGLPGGLILEGYGQAGVVGLRRRDLFADGALRLARPLADPAGPRLGVGAWGAAQPGLARLDLGPHLAVPLNLGPQAVTLALDARIRVAGNARPGSGVALTLGTDF